MNTLTNLFKVLLLCLPFTGWAQLQEFPVERKASPHSDFSARIKAVVAPRSLPFWDDFSFAASYPVDSMWINNTTVQVSNGQGINPPTINVATFDGLKADGTPYSPSPSDYLDFGFRDTLETQPIKMTEVSLPFRNTVFLSFFYQWMGNGEPPDENDYLKLEFKNDQGIWKEVATFRTEPDVDPAEFYPYSVRINQEEFFHDDFRFRFISYGRKSGRYDAWHIDYVYLDDERNIDPLSFPDRSVNIRPSSTFDAYYAIPASHFLASQTLTTPLFGLSNLEAISQPMNYLLNTHIRSFGNDVLLSENIIQLKDTISPSITPYEKRILEMEALPDFSNFDINSDSIEIDYEFILNSGDTIRVDYGGLDFRTNDTLTFHYSLSSFYAYDDGEAEYAAGLTQPGNQLAYKFDMLTSEKDTLNGLFIHYPVFAGESPTSVEMFILRNSNGQPGEILYEQLIPVSRAADNTFIEVPFQQGVPVEESFFIGYTEPVSSRVRIGLDKSNDTSNKLYYRTSSSIPEWSPNDRVYGSLMIRPRFGKAPDVVVGLPETQSLVSFYPNPNKGEFYVKGNTTIIGIFGMTGQPANFTTEESGEQKKITVSNPSSGFYFVKYTNGSGVSTAKIRVHN